MKGVSLTGQHINASLYGLPVNRSNAHGTEFNAHRPEYDTHGPEADAHGSLTNAPNNKHLLQSNNIPLHQETANSTTKPKTAAARRKAAAKLKAKQKLQALCSRYRSELSLRHTVYVNYYNVSNDAAVEDKISLISQLTSARFHMLRKVADYWTGSC